MAKRKIRVGLDFDGVVAYNPARLVRAGVKWFKKQVLGINKLSFMVPEGALMKWLWIAAHESSVFPAHGVERLKQLSQSEEIEFYLITGRFPILEKHLLNWLVRNNLEDKFKLITLNRNYDQPHTFKLKTVEKLGLDYFVEDNLDIVMYLKGKTKAQIFWIYNLIDKRHVYEFMFPDLDAALKKISPKK